MTSDQPVGSVAGLAVVRFGRQRELLAPGAELTFGRGRDRDVRFGHDPRDDLISREAGTLTGMPDGILIRNTSRTQPFQFTAMPGPELTVRPGMGIGTMPFGQIRLDLLGRHGRSYSLHLDVRGMQTGSATPTANEAAPTATKYAPTRLSERELRLLAALCEPMLVLAGSRPATYRQIAERLGGTATANSVRTGLDRLRNRLSDEDGIPGLRTGDDEPGTKDATHYVEALARWALDSRQIEWPTVERILDHG